MENILKAFKEATSKSEVCRILGYHTNGTGFRKINSLILEYSIDISHFDKGLSKRIKYPKINKECPSCGNIFETREGAADEKTTCSNGCANTFFRSGVNSPNWKHDAYRSTCFHYHKKECVICGEKNLVDVHHFDENHQNNSIENLIPLCPTHHQYCHSRYKELIIEEIIAYRNNFIKTVV